MKKKNIGCLLAGLLLLAGCSTTENITINEEVPKEGGSEQTTVQKTEPEADQSDAPVVHNQFGQSVYDAFEQAGYGITGSRTETTDSGNTETVFDAAIAGGTVHVYVTDALTNELAQKTFDANVQNDEANNMMVMASGENGSKKIEVIRNNRANANFVEVLDLEGPGTVHVENELPEQLDPVLAVFESIGFPTADEN